MCGLVSTVSYHCDFPISLSCCYTFLISSTWFYYTSIVCLISTIIFIHVWVFFPTAYFVMYLLSPMISQCINSLTSSLLNPSHLFWSLSSSLDFPQMPSHPWLLTHVRAGRADTWRSSGHWVRSVSLGFAVRRFGWVISLGKPPGIFRGFLLGWSESPEKSLLVSWGKRLEMVVSPTISVLNVQWMPFLGCCAYPQLWLVFPRTKTC